jgi:hypothetical protein
MEAQKATETGLISRLGGGHNSNMLSLTTKLVNTDRKARPVYFVGFGGLCFESGKITGHSLLRIQ